MSEFSWKPSRVLRYLRPLIKLVEAAAETGIIVGTEAAKYQGETGIAGQTGYGGGAWTPEIVEQEMNYVTVGGIGGGFVV
jgi:hypothetical protein